MFVSELNRVFLEVYFSAQIFWRASQHCLPFGLRTVLASSTPWWLPVFHQVFCLSWFLCCQLCHWRLGFCSCASAFLKWMCLPVNPTRWLLWHLMSDRQLQA